MGEMTLIMDSDENRAWYSPDVDNSLYRDYPLKTVRQIMTKTSPELGMLPPAVRWISNWLEFQGGARRAYVLLERPPHRRVVYVNRWSNAHYGQDHVAVEITVPWQHYIAEVNQDRDGRTTGRHRWFAFWSSSQIYDEDHVFYSATLPNIVASPNLVGGTFPTLCLGSAADIELETARDGIAHVFDNSDTKSFDSYAKEALSLFWASPFNHDVSSYVTEKWKRYLYDTYRDDIDPKPMHSDGIQMERAQFITGFNTELYMSLLGQVPMDVLLDEDFMSEYLHRSMSFRQYMDWMIPYDKSQMSSISDLFLKMNEKYS